MTRPGTESRSPRPLAKTLLIRPMVRFNSRSEVVRLLAKWYDTKSNVKLGWFRSQLRASYVSIHTEELWYKETVCLWMKMCVCIYIYIYTNFIEHNRHFLSTYILLDPFILPYWFYRIRKELIYVLPIVTYIPSIFCNTNGPRRKYVDRNYVQWNLY